MGDPLTGASGLLLERALTESATSTGAVEASAPSSPLISSVNTIADALDKDARGALELTIDHTIPRQLVKDVAPELLVDPGNLSFYTRWDNSVKNVKPEGMRPSFAPQSLAEASANGTFARASESMLSRRFSETTEVKSLWEKASEGGTLSYETAQKRFWELVRKREDEAARLVGEALDHAQVKNVRGTNRFALDPEALGLTSLGRRVEGGFSTVRKALESVEKSVGHGLKSFGPGLLTGIVTGAAVEAVKQEDTILHGGAPNAQAADWMASRGWHYDDIGEWRYDPTMLQGLENVTRFFLINTDPDSLDELQNYQRQRRGRYDPLPDGI